MASVLPTPSDCCNTCVCNVVEIELPCSGGAAGPLVVESTAALRLVLANQRTDDMFVVVLTDIGTPMDGTGYQAVWRAADLTPDNPIISVRPADVLSDLDPGRFLQYL